MTQHPEEEPVIRDKRRLDPTTGEVRDDAPEASAAVGENPAGGVTAEDEATDGATAEGEPAAAADPVAAAKAEALDLADQLARAKADNYNLDQRFNAYVRRSRAEASQAREGGRADVIEALIGVLDDIELARQHGELSGPFASIADKLEGTLSGSFAMVRYGAPGEEFDPEVHEALMHSEDPEVTTETVQQVLQPGYKVGEKVVRPARVAVVGPQAG